MRILLILSILFIQSVNADENFLLVNGLTHRTLVEIGSELEKPITPCSSFKIVLSLMGFDAEILEDEQSPVWHYQDGYDDFLETWKAPQTPHSWMTYSCLWYSKVIAEKLGPDRFQNYLDAFEYGNQDMSGGLTTNWVNSSLKISPRDQVAFMQKLVEKQLPVSQHAFEMTKNILFKEELPNGWKLYGKTGWSGTLTDDLSSGWFVGWIERDNEFMPFAYVMRDHKIDLNRRIPRVKELIAFIFEECHAQD